MADMTTNPTNVLTSVNLGELIRSTALAIADAQIELDKAAVRVAEMMSGSSVLRDPVTFMPIDARGMVPQRSSGGVFYASKDPADQSKFEPVMLDTRVFFGRDLDGTPVRMSLFELGFTPTFYQFVDTILELKIAMTMTSEQTSDVKNKGVVTEVSSSSDFRVGGWGGGFQATSRYQAKATPIDATYSSKYNYAVEGSSLFRTKLVPVPPPAILEQRIRDQMSLEAERKDLLMRSMPVARVLVTPASAVGRDSVELAAKAVGGSFAWEIPGTVPAGLQLASTGVLTIDRTALVAKTTSVTVKATCEKQSATATIALT
jgi:hypothetical protein